MGIWKVLLPTLVTKFTWSNNSSLQMARWEMHMWVLISEWLGTNCTFSCSLSYLQAGKGGARNKRRDGRRPLLLRWATTRELGLERGTNVLNWDQKFCKETRGAKIGGEGWGRKKWKKVSGVRKGWLCTLALWHQGPWQALPFWGSSLFILGKMQPPVSKRKVFKRLIKSTQKAFWTSNSS